LSIYIKKEPMPIIKSAIKKLRKDRKREKVNDAKRQAYKRAIKKAQKSKKAEDIKTAVSLIDKTVKAHLIHANKAARIKSKLAKLIAKPIKAKVEAGTVKTPPRKEAKPKKTASKKK